jgi:hypothetical protein
MLHGPKDRAEKAMPPEEIDDDDTRRHARPFAIVASVSRSRAHHCQARLQPLDGAAGCVVRASVHRPGLCVQRLQSSDDTAARGSQSAPGDWKLTDLGWIFSLAMVFLGLSAAVFGAR